MKPDLHHRLLYMTDDETKKDLCNGSIYSLDL